MSDLISRQAAIDAFHKELHESGEREYAIGFGGVEKILKDLPSVEAVPAVHGRLTKIGEDFVYQCSVCQGKMLFKGAYCKNCGAKMDGGEDAGRTE